MNFVEEYYGQNDDLFFIFSEFAGGHYFLWEFLPIMITISTSLLWEIVDVKVRQLEPYYQLTRRGGAKLQDSLSMNYITTFQFVAPFQAFRNGHWAVCLSSTINLLALGPLPTLTKTIWKVSWSTELDHAVVTIKAPYLRVMQALLVILILLGLILQFILRRKSGLLVDPRGIGGTASLISGSNIPRLFQHLLPYDKQKTIDTTLANARFQLCYQGSEGSDKRTQGKYLIVAELPLSMQVEPSSAPFKQSRVEAHPIWLWGRSLLGIELLLVGPYVVVQLAMNSVTNINPVVVMGLYTFSTTVVSAMWQICQREVSILEPYYRLSDHDSLDSRRAKALYFDYVSAPPIAVMIYALSHRSGMVGLISLCSFASQLSTIVFPAIFALRYEQVRATGNYFDTTVIPPTWSSAFTIISIIGGGLSLVNFIGFCALVRRRRRRPFLPRKPTTLSSTILYLCNSTRLLDDFAGTSMLAKKTREAEVQAKGGEYLFGWFDVGGGVPKLGIERKPIRNRYVYGQNSTNELGHL